MKRFLAVIMAAVVAFSTMPLAFAADVTPVILVSGFGATTLVKDGEAVFPPSLNTILDAVGINEDLTVEKAISELEIWLQDEGYVVQLAAIVSRMMENIRVNSDGTSAYDVEPIISGAENTSLAAFKEQDMLDYVPYTGSEFLDMESIGDRIGDENVFNFTYDWREDYNLVADEFKGYIDDVLELTGADKVSVYSISQGCLVVGQYLYKYSELEQTDKVIFDTPVLGGSTFVADLLTPGRTNLNFPVILSLVSDVLHAEIDIAGISPILEGDFIMGAIDIGKLQCILPVVLPCIAFWQMVPVDMFEEKAAALLDSKEHAEVIEAVRVFHKGFMSNITETFEKATEHGSVISIKACTGFDIVTDSNAYSDSIVDMEYSCGAICAPYGESFPEDYVQAVDNGKNSISPDRTVDISAGYWPDRTWVFNGLYHGQAEWCPKSLALLEELLYTDNIKDAYSSYDFPQFIQSESPTSDISMRFINTNSNFLLLDDGREEYTMVIKNVSKKNAVVINSVNCDNGAVTFDNPCGTVLASGESMNIAVSASEAKSGKITVKYAEMKNMFETMEKSFGVTVLEKYSGATADDNMPENSGIQYVFKNIIGFFIDVFNKIISFFKF
ncbi:MAG: hypothetical protein E7547_06640 [Ruminococcaceae bacterium]|nr:hypothetical protein [Oscillospiraceae bacterium]